MNEEIVKQLLASSGFWTAIGIAIGTVTNLFAWYLQTLYQSRSGLRKLRFEKLSELAIFFDLVDKKVRGAHSATITEGVAYWLKEKDHWKDVSFLQSRITVQMYFRKSLSEFDLFLKAMQTFTSYVKHVVAVQGYDPEMFTDIESQIEFYRNEFLQRTGQIYVERKLLVRKGHMYQNTNTDRVATNDGVDDGEREEEVSDSDQM